MYYGFCFFLEYPSPLWCDVLDFTDLIAKKLAEHMADTKENMDSNFLMSLRTGNNMVMINLYDVCNLLLYRAYCSYQCFSNATGSNEVVQWYPVKLFRG